MSYVVTLCAAVCSQGSYKDALRALMAWCGAGQDHQRTQYRMGSALHRLLQALRRGRGDPKRPQQRSCIGRDDVTLEFQTDACHKPWLLHPKQAKSKQYPVSSQGSGAIQRRQKWQLCSRTSKGILLIFSHLAKHSSSKFINICPGQICPFQIKLIDVTIKYSPQWNILKSSPMCTPYPSSWKPQILREK